MTHPAYLHTLAQQRSAYAFAVEIIIKQHVPHGAAAAQVPVEAESNGRTYKQNKKLV